MNTENTGIFDDNQDDNSVTVDVLVGEDRKYSDTNALAKAYVNAEDFIETLKAENARLRAAQDLASNNQTNTDPGPTRTDNTGVQTPDNRNPSDVDWRTTIREELKTLTAEDKYNNNLTAASSKMLEVYGSQESANKAIRARANELGVSVEWLKDSAGKSPAAFFATMEVAQRNGSVNTPAPKNEVRINPLQSNDRNFAYYEGLRRSDKARYFSVAVQQEMMAQAKALGSKFYN